MSLKDFQTILVPSKKTGALQFYHKPTKSILEAAFSRPVIGVTSGAMVFDKNGNLIEKGEDDPDWSFHDGVGCPRLMMRPQRENTLHTFAEAGLTFLGDVVNPYGVSLRKYSINGGAQAQVRFGAAQLGTLTNGTRYLIKWFVQVINPAGSDRFRIESLSTNVGVAATSWEFNGTLNAFGDVSDMEMIDIGDGHYELRAFWTPSAGDETPIALDFQVQDGGSDPTAGGVFAFGGYMLIENGDPDDYIFTDGSNPLTRSANQFTFNDLISKGVIGPGEGSMILHPRNFRGVTTQGGVVVLGLNDGAILSGRGFGCAANTGSARYYASLGSGSAFQFFRSPAEPVVYTWDAQGVKAYDVNGLVASDPQTLPASFNGFIGLSNGNTFELKPQDLAFTPFAITEAQAINAIREAQNL